MRITIWLSLILALVASSPASAVGKVTVDPNIPGARVTAAAPEADSRLDQKITYKAKRKTVSAILADLTKLTGVTFSAGYNNLDWQTRDRRMNIFARDIRLKDLMDSIAHVMKFKWSRKDQGGAWTYRLYMDRKTLLGAERQRLIEEDRLGQLEIGQREKVLDNLTRAAAMSDEELEALKIDDPMLYVHAKIGWPALMPDLFSQVPGAKDAWSSGEMLSLNGADLPPEAQQAVTKTLGTMGQFLDRVIGPGQGPSAEAMADLSKISIEINSARKALGFRGDTYVGDVTVRWPGGGDQTAFINPDSPAARATGEDYVRILENGPVGGQEQGRMNHGHLQAVEGQKTDFGEPVIEHPDDPALLAKVKILPGGNGFADLFASVAKASGYAVVSDSFATVYRGFDPLNSDLPLKDVLSKISTLYRYNWEKRGGVIEFRDRDWFRKRASQVPEAWLEPWRKALDKTGTLNIDQLSQMALLDDEQARENLYSDDVLNARGVSDVLFGYSDLLKAYGCLDSEQQAALFAPNGLDFGVISPTQWTTVSRAFRAKPMLKVSPDAGTMLIANREQVGKLFKYTFVLSTSADAAPTKWEFTTPKYDLVYKIRVMAWTDVGGRALDLFAEAKKARLSDTEAWFHVAMALYDGEHYPESLEALGQVIASAKADPDDLLGSYVWKGHILDLTGRREEAILAYKEALKLATGGASMQCDQYDIIMDRKWVEKRLKVPFERK